MNLYLDSSAICRYYHPEAGSQKVTQLAASPGVSLIISWLGMLETQSAFAMKVRTAEITEQDFFGLCKGFRADIATRRLLMTRVVKRHYDRGQLLIRRYGPTRSLRSLDAIHLGSALDLFERGLLNTVVTADSMMEFVALQEGLSVINPLAP